MISRIKLWFVAFAAALLAFMGIYLAGRQSEKASENRRRVKVMREANEVQDEVNDMGADTRRDTLARWVRDQ